MPNNSAINYDNWQIATDAIVPNSKTAQLPGKPRENVARPCSPESLLPNPVPPCAKPVEGYKQRKRVKKKSKPKIPNSVGVEELPKLHPSRGVINLVPCEEPPNLVPETHATSTLPNLTKTLKKIGPTLASPAGEGPKKKVTTLDAVSEIPENHLPNMGAMPNLASSIIQKFTNSGKIGSKSDLVDNPSIIHNRTSLPKVPNQKRSKVCGESKKENQVKLPHKANKISDTFQSPESSNLTENIHSIDVPKENVDRSIEFRPRLNSSPGPNNGQDLITIGQSDVPLGMSEVTITTTDRLSPDLTYNTSKHCEDSVSLLPNSFSSKSPKVLKMENGLENEQEEKIVKSHLESSLNVPVAKELDTQKGSTNEKQQKKREALEKRMRTSGTSNACQGASPTKATSSPKKTDFKIVVSLPKDIVGSPIAKAEHDPNLTGLCGKPKQYQCWTGTSKPPASKKTTTTINLTDDKPSNTTGAVDASGDSDNSVSNSALSSSFSERKKALGVEEKLGTKPIKKPEAIKKSSGFANENCTVSMPIDVANRVGCRVKDNHLPPNLATFNKANAVKSSEEQETLLPTEPISNLAEHPPYSADQKDKSVQNGSTVGEDLSEQIELSRAAKIEQPKPKSAIPESSTIISCAPKGIKEKIIACQNASTNISPDLGTKISTKSVVVSLESSVAGVQSGQHESPNDDNVKGGAIVESSPVEARITRSKSSKPQRKSFSAKVSMRTTKIVLMAESQLSKVLSSTVECENRSDKTEILRGLPSDTYQANNDPSDLASALKDNMLNESQARKSIENPPVSPRKLSVFDFTPDDDICRPVTTYQSHKDGGASEKSTHEPCKAAQDKNLKSADDGNDEESAFYKNHCKQKKLKAQERTRTSTKKKFLSGAETKKSRDHEKPVKGCKPKNLDKIDHSQDSLVIGEQLNDKNRVLTRSSLRTSDLNSCKEFPGEDCCVTAILPTQQVPLKLGSSVPNSLSADSGVALCEKLPLPLSEPGTASQIICPARNSGGSLLSSKSQTEALKTVENSALPTDKKLNNPLTVDAPVSLITPMMEIAQHAMLDDPAFSDEMHSTPQEAEPEGAKGSSPKSNDDGSVFKEQPIKEPCDNGRPSSNDHLLRPTKQNTTNKTDSVRVVSEAGKQLNEGKSYVLKRLNTSESPTTYDVVENSDCVIIETANDESHKEAQKRITRSSHSSQSPCSQKSNPKNGSYSKKKKNHNAGGLYPLKYCEIHDDDNQEGYEGSGVEPGSKTDTNCEKFAEYEHTSLDENGSLHLSCNPKEVEKQSDRGDSNPEFESITADDGLMTTLHNLSKSSSVEEVVSNNGKLEIVNRPVLEDEPSTKTSTKAVCTMSGPAKKLMEEISKEDILQNDLPLNKLGDIASRPNQNNTIVEVSYTPGDPKRRKLSESVQIDPKKQPTLAVNQHATNPISINTLACGTDLIIQSTANKTVTTPTYRGGKTDILSSTKLSDDSISKKSMNDQSSSTPTSDHSINHILEAEKRGFSGRLEKPPTVDHHRNNVSSIITGKRQNRPSTWACTASTRRSSVSTFPVNSLGWRNAQWTNDITTPLHVNTSFEEPPSPAYSPDPPIRNKKPSPDTKSSRRCPTSSRQGHNQEDANALNLTVHANRPESIPGFDLNDPPRRGRKPQTGPNQKVRILIKPLGEKRTFVQGRSVPPLFSKLHTPLRPVVSDLTTLTCGLPSEVHYPSAYQLHSGTSRNYQSPRSRQQKAKNLETIVGKVRVTSDHGHRYVDNPTATPVNPNAEKYTGLSRCMKPLSPPIVVDDSDDEVSPQTDPPLNRIEIQPNSSDHASASKVTGLEESNELTVEKPADASYKNNCIYSQRTTPTLPTGTHEPEFFDELDLGSEVQIEVSSPVPGDATNSAVPNGIPAVIVQSIEELRNMTVCGIASEEDDLYSAHELEKTTSTDNDSVDPERKVSCNVNLIPNGIKVLPQAPENGISKAIVVPLQNDSRLERINTIIAADLQASEAYPVEIGRHKIQGIARCDGLEKSPYEPESNAAQIEMSNQIGLAEMTPQADVSSETFDITAKIQQTNTTLPISLQDNALDMSTTQIDQISEKLSVGLMNDTQILNNRLEKPPDTFDSAYSEAEVNFSEPVHSEISESCLKPKNSLSQLIDSSAEILDLNTKTANPLSPSKPEDLLPDENVIEDNQTSEINCENPPAQPGLALPVLDKFSSIIINSLPTKDSDGGYESDCVNDESAVSNGKVIDKKNCTERNGDQDILVSTDIHETRSQPSQPPEEDKEGLENKIPSTGISSPEFETSPQASTEISAPAVIADTDVTNIEDVVKNVTNLEIEGSVMAPEHTIVAPELVEVLQSCDDSHENPSNDDTPENPPNDDAHGNPSIDDTHENPPNDDAHENPANDDTHENPSNDVSSENPICNNVNAETLTVEKDENHKELDESHFPQPSDSAADSETPPCETQTLKALAQNEASQLTTQILVENDDRQTESHRLINTLVSDTVEASVQNEAPQSIKSLEVHQTLEDTSSKNQENPPVEEPFGGLAISETTEGSQLLSEENSSCENEPGSLSVPVEVEDDVVEDPSFPTKESISLTSMQLHPAVSKASEDALLEAASCNLECGKCEENDEPRNGLEASGKSIVSEDDVVPNSIVASSDVSQITESMKNLCSLSPKSTNIPEDECPTTIPSDSCTKYEQNDDISTNTSSSEPLDTPSSNPEIPTPSAGCIVSIQPNVLNNEHPDCEMSDSNTAKSSEADCSSIVSKQVEDTVNDCQELDTADILTTLTPSPSSDDSSSTLKDSPKNKISVSEEKSTEHRQRRGKKRAYFFNSQPHVVVERLNPETIQRAASCQLQPLNSQVTKIPCRVDPRIGDSQLLSPFAKVPKIGTGSEHQPSVDGIVQKGQKSIAENLQEQIIRTAAWQFAMLPGRSRWSPALDKTSVPMTAIDEPDESVLLEINGRIMEYLKRNQDRKVNQKVPYFREFTSVLPEPLKNVLDKTRDDKSSIRQLVGFSERSRSSRMPRTRTSQRIQSNRVSSPILIRNSDSEDSLSGDDDRDQEANKFSREPQPNLGSSSRIPSLLRDPMSLGNLKNRAIPGGAERLNELRSFPHLSTSSSSSFDSGVPLCSTVWGEPHRNFPGQPEHYGNQVGAPIMMYGEDGGRCTMLTPITTTAAILYRSTKGAPLEPDPSQTLRPSAAIMTPRNYDGSLSFPISYSQSKPEGSVHQTSAQPPLVPETTRSWTAPPPIRDAPASDSRNQVQRRRPSIRYHRLAGRTNRVATDLRQKVIFPTT
ncbi:unnamed protein product [Nesidiocoris tenuis]|uniref:Uncharacterized protein n=1 Tax=Nesidiocoris tenuis TaxID=355587 RepID=A0A6H5HNC8_9HEMI|nr:unnamed protein product [Nesidiocoris tenuis]